MNTGLCSWVPALASLSRDDKYGRFASPSIDTAPAITAPSQYSRHSSRADALFCDQVVERVDLRIKHFEVVLALGAVLA
jgi:hypothetical protein